MTPPSARGLGAVQPYHCPDLLFSASRCRYFPAPCCRWRLLVRALPSSRMPENSSPNRPRSPTTSELFLRFRTTPSAPILLHSQPSSYYRTPPHTTTYSIKNTKLKNNSHKMNSCKNSLSNSLATFWAKGRNNRYAAFHQFVEGDLSNRFDTNSAEELPPFF